jgi:hypothetical protein
MLLKKLFTLWMYWMHEFQKTYYHVLITVVVHPLIKYLLIICDRQEWIVETWDCTTSLLSVERIRFENSILK